MPPEAYKCMIINTFSLNLGFIRTPLSELSDLLSNL
jgi:hypothetical protein